MHWDTSITKHYARVLDQNIFKDMQKVNSCCRNWLYNKDSS